ncbi:MAG: peptide ABC transporter substrate-binding protein [Pyrinomonadaceae bacterium]
MPIFPVQRRSLILAAAAAFLMSSSCAQLKQPEPEPYFAETPPPPVQEFRWANGKPPKSLDPAKAAAAPETDIARALFEGLTDLDPQTLAAVPAVAERWDASDDKRVWRFYLREEAVWSNGEKITAEDFVRSWKRLAALGDEAAHRALLKNIRGLADPAKRKEGKALEPTPSATPPPADGPPTASGPSPSEAPVSAQETLGVAAEGDRVLRVELNIADPDLPQLLAHPIFRPVHDDPAPVDDDQMVTNGPFRLSSLSDESVVVDRSETYWDHDSVKLERVKFVSSETPEKALEAYRSGAVDAVTNAEFSPAALKLLEPFDDFRRTAHNALNFYEFNTKRAPFDDRRVREALAIAIDREKITEGELQGTTRPANTFLPQGSKKELKLLMDLPKARSLLEEAGFPEGAGFPVVRLVINRNDTQQRIARAVADMWSKNLGITTEIVTIELAELDAVRAAGDYDLIRRGVVMPTSNETASLLSIFEAEPTAAKTGTAVSVPRMDLQASNANIKPDTSPAPQAGRSPAPARLTTESEAVYEVRAIPLYFPTSYSLVKPYVAGFDSNSLDAPSLKTIHIDPKWRTR